MFTEIKDVVAKLTMIPDLILGFSNKLKEFFSLIWEILFKIL